MEETTYEKAFRVLCEIFKIKNLKDYQKEALICLHEHIDCFVCQPTGCGKSAVFQMLPFFCHIVKFYSSEDMCKDCNCNYMVLVISPLISLIKDQVMKLKKMGIAAGSLICDSGFVSDDSEEILCKNIVFTSPESILTKFRHLLKNSKVNSRLVGIAIDESHCVLKWGSTSTQAKAFRQHYNQLSELRSLTYQPVPIVCLTATATLTTRNHVISNLCLKHPVLITTSPDRPNIKYWLLKTSTRQPAVFFENVLEQLKLKSYKAEKLLIFCRLMTDMRQIYNYFDTNLDGLFQSFQSRPYAKFHSQTDNDVKNHVIEQFSRADGTIRVLIATIAFGMGIDCQGLYTIIHFGPPAQLDDYFQESGRAGRDGKASDAVLVLYPRSIGSKNISTSMKHYCKNESICRRKLLLHEFDGIVDKDCIRCERCCDLCSSRDITDQHSSLLSLWWRPVLQHSEDTASAISTTISDTGNTILSHQLETLRENVIANTKIGHCGTAINTGFPRCAIEEIVKKANENFSYRDLDETSLLNQNYYDEIIDIIKNVCSTHKIIASTNVQDEEDSDEEEEEESDVETDTDSDNNSDGDVTFRYRVYVDSDEEF